MNLEKKSITGYLQRKKLTTRGTPLTIEQIGDGMKNQIYVATTAQQRLLVKQAHSKVQIKERWWLDRKRISAEKNCIDILANNPFGGTGQHFLELTEKNWDLNIDIGLKGFYLCSQQAAFAMVEQGEGGAIVSTSSVHGSRAWKTDTAYGVAKAGVLRLTESMAVDLGEHGIRCNAILPGHMNTDHEYNTPPPALGSMQPQFHEGIPLCRRGTPEDVGRAAAFLCSNAAGCITGVSLPVDGGLLVTAAH